MSMMVEDYLKFPENLQISYKQVIMPQYGSSYRIKADVSDHPHSSDDPDRLQVQVMYVVRFFG